MRFSARPATCLVSLCFATASSTAFVVCPISWRGNLSPFRLQRAGCVRSRPSTVPDLSMDTSPIAKMQSECGPKTSKRDAVHRAFTKIIERRQGGSQDERQAITTEIDARIVSRGVSWAGNQGKTRRFKAGCRQGVTWVRKGMAGVAAAVIIRTTFAVSSASALPAPVSTRPKTLQQQSAPTEEIDMAAYELAVEEALAEALAEAEAEETAVDGEAGTANGKSETDMETGEGESIPGVSRPLNRHERSEVLRAKLKEKGFNHNSVQRRRLPFNPFMATVKGAGAIFFYLSIVKGSVSIMERQKKRVRVESNKFEQQRDEFMDVEGEAEVDVDIMKELRDLKEKMAGPGDSYAKDTRAYNPKFADENPEEEYDARLQEMLGRKKRKKTNPDSTEQSLENEVAASGDGEEDLLGDNAGEGLGEGLGDLAAEGTSQATDARKDMDLERLERLFDDSPSEDTDSPEDDLGDKRELLP